MERQIVPVPQPTPSIRAALIERLNQLLHKIMEDTDIDVLSAEVSNSKGNDTHTIEIKRVKQKYDFPAHNYDIQIRSKKDY